MLSNKREHPKEKSGLHPRNKHRERYDFKLLVSALPELGEFVIVNKFNDESIDFHNPMAVKMLNKALLKAYYEMNYWDIPKNYLCPPIPGRADYIHHIAELLYSEESNKNKKIKCLDIGVGANLIYPIIGINEYDWNFVGTDIDPIAIANAEEIIKNNPKLKDKVELRLQIDPSNIFDNIFKEDEYFDVVICNPPFHSSQEEASANSIRKINNLRGTKVKNPVLNFGGHANELWTEGGEGKFIETMIEESELYSDACGWFSTLVSKNELLDKIYHLLKNFQAKEVKTINMNQGNKMTRIVAWKY